MPYMRDNTGRRLDTFPVAETPTSGFLSLRPADPVKGQSYLATDQWDGTLYMCLVDDEWTQVASGINASTPVAVAAAAAAASASRPVEEPIWKGPEEFFNRSGSPTVGTVNSRHRAWLLPDAAAASLWTTFQPPVGWAKFKVRYRFADIGGVGGNVNISSSGWPGIEEGVALSTANVGAPAVAGVTAVAGQFVPFGFDTAEIDNTGGAVSLYVIRNTASNTLTGNLAFLGAEFIATELADPSNSPYSGVDWGAVTPLMGSTHAHTQAAQGVPGGAGDQAYFNGYVARGIKAHGLSNYYPSQPTCPLGDFYTGVPGDAICIPNSEVHSVTNMTSVTHLCALGSTVTYTAGANQTWQETFDDIFAALAYPTGGGIIMAHPNWSLLSVQNICDMLDYDERVLGIESFNGFVEGNTDYSEERRAPALPLWDAVLSTGRRCFGFWVMDHKYQAGAQGRSMLLVEANTAQAVLEAYRNGHFYGALEGVGLALTGFTTGVVGGQRLVTVTTDAADEIRMIVNGQTVETVTADTATFVIPSEAVYARFEAENEADTIYTQPVMYTA